MNDVYIIRSSCFLPNNVIKNDEIESYLGSIGNQPSRARAIVLRSNRIRKRYFALDKSGKTTHTNYELTALVVRELFKNQTDKFKSVDLLCCGTSSPDQIMPSHGVMVHGELKEMNNIEVITPSGNCCAGMHALKYSYLAIKSGDKNYAVSTGSERISGILRATHFEQEVKHQKILEKNPYIAFKKDFLRWMLSDGAGAFLLSNNPNKNELSLKVNWIESVSFANQEEVCMYMGAKKESNGSLKGYMECSPDELINESIFSIKQDVKILDDKIIELGFEKIPEIFKKHNIEDKDIDYFLVHMSSYFFEDKIADFWRKIGFDIPKEKWFNNLAYKGNVGAGSAYLMIDELLKSKKIIKGQKILLIVPESARFSYVFSYFTVC